MKFTFEKFEKTVGNMKFAVLSISLFTLFMIVGTLLESYFGTDYANRIIYKKLPFMLVQFCMFASILFAAFLRLPPKKRLYGFYTIHTGLILIGCGSVVTYIAGVDGSIYLPPGGPARHIVLSDDILKITYPNEGRQITADLPYTAFQSNFNKQFEELNFLRYFPYSMDVTKWDYGDKTYPSFQSIHSTEYMIYNDRFSQKFTMSLHPEAIDYTSSTQLGPLGVHYLPSSLAECFNLKSETGLVLWNSIKNKCFTFESFKSKIQTIKKTKKRFFVIQENNDLLTFFPDLSPFPLNKELMPVRNSPLRVFNLGIFENKPNLFVFGKKTAYYKDGVWTMKEFNGKSVELPWMGFHVEMLKHNDYKFPSKVPEYVTPIQKNSKIIRGDQRAIELIVKGKKYWITDRRPISLMLGPRKVIVEITKKQVKLPFEIVLRNFKMDKNPGTNSPASYESFVTLFTKKGPVEQHVYMNNPFKKSGFTFYQASYNQNQDGSYSSTLSANVDQGRPIKYFGSFLLVIGCIWHFYINRQKDLIT
ncbi:MAG: hypothetical protein HN576_03815 [Bacteriovoracaceae bacterium]|jgi:hypothetical protein|nr:hypothetical protein [Bacteriovoracaceae bacterium]